MEINEVEKRIKKIKEIMKRPEIGSKLDICKRTLNILEEKFEILTKNPYTRISEVTSKQQSEEDLIYNLGPIYWVFGPSFEQSFSFKNYRIEFIKLLPNDAEDFGQVLKVQVEIYEDDEPLVTEDAVISFWKGWANSTEVDDIDLSYNQQSKYTTCHWFNCIAYSLATTWNEYFKDMKL